jgi:multiple antibiotic resistance protein
MVSFFVELYLKFFFLLTPFFVMSTFMSMTTGMEVKERRFLAIRVTLAVLVTSVVIALIGNWVFSVFGITLDAFRIGTGFLLFYNAFDLVHGGKAQTKRTGPAPPGLDDEDIAVVPLAIPVTVGPGTTGALLVLGSELNSANRVLAGLSAIGLAIFTVGALLVASSYLERLIKRQGFVIMSKITGLILSALAAQLILTGIMNFVQLFQAAG